MVRRLNACLAGLANAVFHLVFVFASAQIPDTCTRKTNIGHGLQLHCNIFVRGMRGLLVTIVISFFNGKEPRDMLFFFFGSFLALYTTHANPTQGREEIELFSATRKELRHYVSVPNVKELNSFFPPRTAEITFFLSSKPWRYIARRVIN